MIVAPSGGPLHRHSGCQVKTVGHWLWKSPLKAGKPIGGVEEVAKEVLVVGAW